MKKCIFALLCVAFIASIPSNASATTTPQCEINVANNTTKTISNNLNAATGSNNCHVVVEEKGTLIVTGAISAYNDYAINNRGGTVVINGGSVKSEVHNAIWSKGGIVTVKSDATLSSANGYEENITFADDGTLNICGNYSYSTINNANVTVNNLCPAPAKAPAKTPTKAQTTTPSSESKETITITITTRKKTNTHNTNTQNTATKSTPKSSASAPSTRQTQSTPTNTEKSSEAAIPAETKIEKKVEAKTKTKTQKTADEETLPEAGNNNNNTFAIIIAATIAVLGSATTAILINRLRA